MPRLTELVLKMMDEWQPLDTIPEDVDALIYTPERRFMVSSPNDGMVESIEPAHMAVAHREGESHITDGEYSFFPTHWMPLPAPPAAHPEPQP